MTLSSCGAAFLAILLLPTFTLGQSSQAPSAAPTNVPSIVQATLVAPGSTPFHLKATITERGDPTYAARVEIFWLAPDKWRRTIQSQEFSQTLIVNGDKVFEQDSDDYLPVALNALVTAMVDPKPVLDALRPGDRLMTKANGASKESGVVCFSANGGMCGRTPHGLMEIVGAPGRSVDFTDYQDFKGKRVSRLLIYHIDPGDSLKAQVEKLEELKKPAPELFSIEEPTAREKQIQTVILREAELRASALDTPDIIWPQVLDGATTGPTSYYVSVDRRGRVRETLPLHSANERADDSARRQIMRWKFKPIVNNGVAVQAESVLTFALNTRAWGPPAPLNDAEARKLASNIGEPVFPPDAAPQGTTYTLWVAIDHEGNVIEVIAGDGPPQLFRPCYEALKKWHFSPFMQDGAPRPYRAQIAFTVQR